MISIGITPGLGSLGYCVLNLTPPAFTGYTENCDILLGAKHSTADLLKKANVHRLILDVVIERWPPSVLVIGPQLRKKESPEHVRAACDMVKLLAKAFGIPTISIDNRRLLRVLNKRKVRAPVSREAPPSGPKKRKPSILVELVEHRLETPIESHERRIVLAAATALAGAILYTQRNSDVFSRETARL